MRQQLEERLVALKSEYDKGQSRFRQLEGELTSLRETLLRISGAIQVLQELLSTQSSPVHVNSDEVDAGSRTNPNIPAA
jgi:predicted nuclease with TOPRIM domain